MPTPLSGPGVGLPLPQYLYPSELANAPLDSSNNYITLNAGDQLPIPAGTWFVDVGQFSVLQYLDPVSSSWRTLPAARGQMQRVKSDGFNLRLANLLGVPVAAMVTVVGSGYVQASTTITPNVGNSTWQAVVGGSLSVTSVHSAGAGYTVPPLLFIPAPPNPGIQATGYCTLTAGTVSAVSLVNFGAGYTSVPEVQILPNPTDPNIASITQATVSIALANSGALTGAICTNPGSVLSTISALTLTVAGAGSGAVLHPVVPRTVTGTSVVAGGVSMGSASQPALVTSVGGQLTSTAAVANPNMSLAAFKPRAFVGSGTCNAGGTISAIVNIDTGMFVADPTAAVAPGAGGTGGGSLAMASITFTTGSTYDTVLLQPAP